MKDFIKKPRNFAPGPTPMYLPAYAAGMQADLHHRTDEFRRYMKGTLEGLQYLLDTRNPVMLFTASGTGVMEAALTNLLSPGDRALVLTAGTFGERWLQLAKAYGIETETVQAPYGEEIPVEEVAKKLSSAGGNPFRAVFLQATETSTGVRHNVRAVAELVRPLKKTCVVVDAITGIGTMELQPDEWGLDIMIGGSQKALMIPPGLAFASVSEKAWKFIGQAKLPRFYFDMMKERKSLEKGEAAFTPAVSLVVALHQALEFIRELGRENLVANAAMLAEAARRAACALGLKLFAPSSPANAVTAISSPEGIDSGAIIREVRSGFGAGLANGQGRMKGKVFRIGHLGNHDILDLIGLIGALEIALHRMGHSVELGAGVRAAQQVYLERQKEEKE